MKYIFITTGFLGGRLVPQKHKE